MTLTVLYTTTKNYIYEWMKQMREYFDLSEIANDHIGDSTNEKGLRKAKDETIYLPIVDFIALNPKCYSFNHLTLDDKKKNTNKKTLKGVSKVVVKSKLKMMIILIP